MFKIKDYEERLDHYFRAFYFEYRLLGFLSKHIGFPIAVTFYLLVRLEKTIKTALSEFSDSIAQLAKTIEKKERK